MNFVLPPSKKTPKNGAVSVFRVQTGTIVCCRCCIWDNTSCCTLAIMMSWCDGVMIPSLSISLWGHKKNNKKTTRMWSKTKSSNNNPPKKEKSRHFSFLFTESGRHIHPEGLNNSSLIVSSRKLLKHHVSN